MINVNTLRKDIPAAIVVFLVALPLCLGIALASGAPLLSGLIAGIVGGLVVGCLSGSHSSVSGPAAGLSAVVLAQINQLGSFDTFLLAVVFAGVLQIILGLLRAGFIANYFPNNVIKGLLAAIGIILILKQLPHAVGYDLVSEGSFSFFQADGLNTLSELVAMLGNFTPAAIIISLISLALLIGWDQSPLKRLPIPSALIVVVVGILLNELFFTNWPDLKLKATHLVNIPLSADGLSSFVKNLTLPNWSQLGNTNVYFAAFTIASVATLETLLNLEAVDKIDPQKRHSPPNRELLAQGVGNVVSGLIGGLPVTSVVVRSSANLSAGAQTKLSAILHSLLLLAFVIAAPVLLNKIPLASLAAILLVLGYKLASLKTFREYYAKGLDQFAPFVVTVLAILFSDLLIGTLVGLSTSVFFLLKANFTNTLHERHEVHPQGTLVRLKLSQEVSFLNRGALITRLNLLETNSDVVIDATGTEYIDHDVLEIIREFSAITAPAKHIRLTLIGFKDRYKLSDKVEWINVLTKDSQQRLTPSEILAHLRSGNERFASGNPLTRDFLSQASSTTKSQYPMAAVLSCIDSRTSAEIIFDVGLGDLFSIRIAGNVANDDIIGSMEFATQVAGAKLIVVLGHTQCGAVKAACDHVELGNLTGLLNKVQPAINRETITTSCRDSSNDDFVYNVTQLHVLETMKIIENSSPIIKTLINQGSIKIVGGLYDLESRKVDFIESSQSVRLTLPKYAIS